MCREEGAAFGFAVRVVVRGTKGSTASSWRECPAPLSCKLARSVLDGCATHWTVQVAGCRSAARCRAKDESVHSYCVPLSLCPRQVRAAMPTFDTRCKLINLRDVYQFAAQETSTGTICRRPWKQCRAVCFSSQQRHAMAAGTALLCTSCRCSADVYAPSPCQWCERT